MTTIKDYLSKRQGNDLTVITTDGISSQKSTLVEYYIESSDNNTVTLTSDVSLATLTLFTDNDCMVEYDETEFAYNVRTNDGTADHIFIEVDDITSIEMFVGHGYAA